MERNPDGVAVTDVTLFSRKSPTHRIARGTPGYGEPRGFGRGYCLPAHLPRGRRHHEPSHRKRGRGRSPMQVTGLVRLRGAVTQFTAIPHACTASMRWGGRRSNVLLTCPQMSNQRASERRDSRRMSVDGGSYPAYAERFPASTDRFSLFGSKCIRSYGISAFWHAMCYTPRRPGKGPRISERRRARTWLESRRRAVRATVLSS